MGAVMSEGATGADLGTDTARLYQSDQKVLKHVGWQLKPYTAAQLVQGLQHVDDAIAFSFVWGTCCLEAGCVALWPADVWVSKEAESPQLLLCGAGSAGTS